MIDPKKEALRMANFWLKRCAMLGVNVNADVINSVNVNGVNINGVNAKEKEKGKENFPPHPLLEIREEQKESPSPSPRARVSDDSSSPKPEEPVESGNPSFERVEKYAAINKIPADFAKRWYDQMNRQNEFMRWRYPKSGKPLNNWQAFFRLYWKCRDEFDPLPEPTAKQETKPRVFTEKDWILCEERCMNYDPIHRCCRVQFAVPPEMRDRPIPPQECRGFLSLPEGITK